MEGSSGEYSSLVIHLAPAPDGSWRLTIDTADQAFELPLRPVTLVVRLWQSHDGRLLRGSIHLDQTVAPFQSNAQLKQIINDWLVTDT